MEPFFDFEEADACRTPPPSPRSVQDSRMFLLESEDREEERFLRQALAQSLDAGLRRSAVYVSSEESLSAASSLKESTGLAHSLGSPFDMEPLIIGISGGTASGKTSVCTAITDQLRDQRVALITLDSYYRPLNAEEKELVSQGQFNFDHPSAFDWELVREHLASVLQRQPIRVPIYDYVNNERFADRDVLVQGVDVVFFEGILAFWDPPVRAMLSLKIFVECDADIRLARRVVRDIAERGRSLEHILDQYEKTVKPSFDKFTLPTKRFADVIIPRGASNTVAIKLLADHFQQKLLLTGHPIIKGEIRKRRPAEYRSRHAVAAAQILEATSSAMTTSE